MTMYDIAKLVTDETPMAELLRLFNEASETMGNKPIAKFSDKPTALKRTRMVLSHVNAAEGVAAARKEASVAAPKTEEKPKTERQNKAAADAIGANKEPAPPAPAKVKSAVPIASNDPVKDAQMPSRRNKKLTDLKPKKRIVERKAGTAQALLVDLLSRSQGATFGEIYDAMANRPERLNAETGKMEKPKPWLGSTINSGLAWDINHIAGYGVRAEEYNGEQFKGQGRDYEANRLGFGTKDYDPDVKMLVYKLTYPEGMTAPLPHTPRKEPPAPKVSKEQKAANKAALEAELKAEQAKKAAPPATSETVTKAGDPPAN